MLAVQLVLVLVLLAAWRAPCKAAALTETRVNAGLPMPESRAGAEHGVGLCNSSIQAGQPTSLP
jgi:hypothetical protein